MSYEDSKCPCGGKKAPGTMLCDQCVEAFKDRPELSQYQDPTLSLELRQHAARILVTLSRQRKKGQPTE